MNCLVALLVLGLIQVQGHSEFSPGDLAFATALSRAGLGTRDLSDSFKARLEELRNLFLNGDPEKGIPILDPMQFDNTHINISLENIIKGTWLNMTLDGGAMNGLASFDVTDLKISLIPLKFTLNLTLPTLGGVGVYNSEGLLANLIPVYGSGPFDVGIEGLNFYVSVALSSSGGYVILKSLDLDFGLYCMHLDAAGFLGGDLGTVLEEIVENNFPELLARFKFTYIEEIRTAVSGLVSKWLECKTVQDIIDIIEGNKNFLKAECPPPM